MATKCGEFLSFQIWFLRLFTGALNEQDLTTMSIQSDNELFLTNDNWPRFIVLTSTSEENHLSKLSPFAVQKGFQAIAGTLNSTERRLRDGSFLVECSRRTQAENLLRTVNFVDRLVHVFVHKLVSYSVGR